jgi:hypothetical protein
MMGHDRECKKRDRATQLFLDDVDEQGEGFGEDSDRKN